jgi:hypothetical protein
VRGIEQQVALGRNYCAWDSQHTAFDIAQPLAANFLKGLPFFKSAPVFGELPGIDLQSGNIIGNVGGNQEIVGS